MHFPALELDLAFLQRKQRVIATDADIEAGREAGTALAKDNRAGGDNLAAIGFDAEVLRIAVAAVSG